MKKYITAALALLTSAIGFSQNAARVDTTFLGIYSTGARFIVTRAAFGAQTPTDLFTDMVIAYDTVQVAATVADTGRTRVRHSYEKRCNLLADLVRNKDLYKDKIVLMDLNAACDFTQICLLAQKSGAKALVFIHNGNSPERGGGNIRLPKLGIYKDSIKVPIFTVGKENGYEISALLPSKAGIRTKTASLQALAENRLLLDLNAIAQADKSQITWVNNTGTANDFFVVQKFNPITGVFEDLQIVNTHQVEGAENYVSYDNNPIDGDNTYRIKLVLNDGSIRYSELKTVRFYASTGITLYPNPADDLLNINFKGYTGQAVDITIFDMQGKSIIKQHIDVLQTETQTLVIADKTSGGQYMILIKSKGKRDVLRQFTVGK